MQLRLTSLLITAACAASAIAKPVGITLGITGEIPPLTSSPIIQEYPADLPCDNSTQALNMYGGYPICNPKRFTAVVATELDAEFLIWTSAPNQQAIEENDMNEKYAASATISTNGSETDGFAVTYPEYRQCTNIDPLTNNGGFVLYWPSEAIYCFYSQPNCVGERVCVTPYGTGSSYNTIIPATENMIKNGLLSSVVLPVKPAGGYKAPYTINPIGQWCS